MSFPSCQHRKKTSQHPAGPGVLAWLAAEPFRLFFFSGAVWSIIGVSLWPLWYAQSLTFYPSITHARIMIECFGGAFVAGFLGTAGPRMATAPKLTPVELLMLFVLHSACGVLHLKQQTAAADRCFAAMLGVLALALVVRVVRFRREAPPPQMLLALTGLGCGLAGTAMWLSPDWLNSLERIRLAGLLVYQGLLLPPVLGIGSFIFPRILGGGFGAPETVHAWRASLLRAVITAALIVGSFFIETAGYTTAAYLVRAGTAAAYLLLEVRWRHRPEDGPRGTLARALPWAMLSGIAGLAAIAIVPRLLPETWSPLQRTALEHLLYIGTFGMLMLIVGSRVLFGHSGELAGFARSAWLPRVLIALGFIAATTRAIADFIPKIMVSHHKYAAEAWALAGMLWLVWHGRRFLKREEE